MIKKMWGISLAGVLAMGLTACSGSQEAADTQPSQTAVETTKETETETQAETKAQEETGDGGMTWDLSLIHIYSGGKSLEL